MVNFLWDWDILNLFYENKLQRQLLLKAAMTWSWLTGNTQYYITTNVSLMFLYWLDSISELCLKGFTVSMIDLILHLWATVLYLIWKFRSSCTTHLNNWIYMASIYGIQEWGTKWKFFYFYPFKFLWCNINKDKDLYWYHINSLLFTLFVLSF